MLRIPLIQLFLTFATSLSMLGTTACQIKERRPNRYLIPEGYVGWVRVNYRIKDAPVLPIEDSFYVLKFPADGVINTASEGEEGFASDEYYYYDENADRQRIRNANDDGLIWGGVAFGSLSARGKEPTKYSEFFVGTKQQFQQVGLKCKDSDLNPIIGPLEKCQRNGPDRLTVKNTP